MFLILQNINILFKEQHKNVKTTYMHELSLCQRIVEIAVDTIPANTKIIMINLEVGELMLVEPKTLVFMFDVVSKNTAVAGAKLTIVSVAAKGQCHSCSAFFIMSKHYDPCPQCHSHDISVINGNELIIKSMEVKPCAESVVAK